MRSGSAKWIFPDVADVLLTADLHLSVFLQEALLLAHADLASWGTDLDEATVATRAKGVHTPSHLGFTAHNGSLLVGHEALSERVVDVDLLNLVSIVLFPLLLVFALIPFLLVSCFLPLLFLPPHSLIFLHPDKLPDIILRNMIGRIWTARYLIEQLTLRMFNLMRMQIVLRLEIAKNDCLPNVMQFPITIDLMQ